METIDFHRNYGSISRGRAFIEFYEDKMPESEFTYAEWQSLSDKFASAFWCDLSDIWASLDAIDHQSMYILMNTFRYDESFLTKECQQDLSALSGDSFTIYRGQSGCSEMSGLAWTLDRTVAEEFARNGIHGSGVETAYLLTTTVRRDDIVMAFSGRRESEVVLMDLDIGYWIDISVEELTPE
ncbi:hypothetical protein G3A39_38425 [Paraburkholderia aspalathi]|nr:hypothetical protein [Paraburkholderia aspalathi]